MPDLNEALSAAFDKHAAEVVEDQPSGGEQHATEEVTPAAPASEATAGRPRDASGRFAPAAKQDEIPADQQPQPKEVKPEVQAAQQPAAQAPAQPLRAPESWRPEVRGKFGALPPDVQEEVTRRERETSQALRQSADSRRFVQEFHSVVSPFEAMIRSEGGTPLSAVQQLFGTAYMLRTAPPQQKAQLVAQMIQQFGVDIGLLDDVLSGQAQPRGGNPQVDYVQQQLQPVQQFMQRITQMEQQAQQRMQENVANEIQAFAEDPKNEFYRDVAGEMADLIEMAARRGQKMSLQDAYQRATMAHPSIGRILADRTLQATAQQKSSAAQRSRAASASLPSGSAPESGSSSQPKPKDLTSAVAAAWDAVEAKGRS